MVENKNVLLGISLGLILGMLLMFFYSFSMSSNNELEIEGITPISTSQANNYYRNYISTASNYNNVIKGFAVDRSQLDAMPMLSIENRNLTGFRIYNGKDETGRTLTMIVGTDSQGKDAVNGSIYNTDSPSFQPCPMICDLTSPIINDK